MAMLFIIAAGLLAFSCVIGYAFYSWFLFSQFFLLIFIIFIFTVTILIFNFTVHTFLHVRFDQSCGKFIGNIYDWIRVPISEHLHQRKTNFNVTIQVLLHCGILTVSCSLAQCMPWCVWVEPAVLLEWCSIMWSSGSLLILQLTHTQPVGLTISTRLDLVYIFRRFVRWKHVLEVEIFKNLLTKAVFLHILCNLTFSHMFVYCSGDYDQGRPVVHDILGCHHCWTHMRYFTLG